MPLLLKAGDCAPGCCLLGHGSKPLLGHDGLPDTLGVPLLFPLFIINAHRGPVIITPLNYNDTEAQQEVTVKPSYTAIDG